MGLSAPKLGKARPNGYKLAILDLVQAVGLSVPQFPHVSSGEGGMVTDPVDRGVGPAPETQPALRFHGALTVEVACPPPRTTRGHRRANVG